MTSSIGFSTTKKFLSRLIRWWTGSSCSHVWFCFYDPFLKTDMVMEAHYTYQLIPLSTFMKNNKIVAVVAPKHDIDDAIRNTTEWLGSWYDAKGLLGMAWVRLGRWLHHAWKNPFRSSKNVYCSEAVTRGLLSIGYPNLTVHDPEVVGPDELPEFFRKETEEESCAA